MKKILIILSVILNLGTVQGQEFEYLIKTDNGKTLYVHTENKFEIDETKYSNEEIELETNNGEIKRFFKGKYMIKPNSLGECLISIYSKGKSKKLITEKFWVIFSVKPEIIPVFYSNDNKAKDNEIPKDKLEDLRGFSTMVFSQNQIIFLIEAMELMIFSKSNGNSEFKSDGKLNEEMKDKLRLLESGDFIILKNIEVSSVSDYSKKDNPDQVIKISPTVFFVK